MYKFQDTIRIQRHSRIQRNLHGLLKEPAHGQKISSIEWQELKNRILSFFFSIDSFQVDKKRDLWPGFFLRGGAIQQAERYQTRPEVQVCRLSETGISSVLKAVW